MDVVKWAYLGGATPTILEIPIGTDSKLQKLFIPFMMGGLVVTVPAFIAGGFPRLYVLLSPSAKRVPRHRCGKVDPIRPLCGRTASEGERSWVSHQASASADTLNTNITSSVAAQ